MSSILGHPSFLVMPTEFRLAEILAVCGMSQRELARLSGVSFVTVNAIHGNRTTRVDLATLDKLAAVLGVQPGELIVKAPKRRKG